MGFQATEFRFGEGNKWYERNRSTWPNRIATDPILSATKDLKPKSVIEIGCGNGWRLEQYRLRCGATGYGVDPSKDAIFNGQGLFPGITLREATATTHDTLLGFDLTVYGFCLYLCDREDLNAIAARGDLVTRDGGHLVIQDFDPEFPHKVAYSHLPGLWSYKMDYSKLWLANPAYTLVSKTVGSDGTAVWILKKDIRNGWPIL